MKTTICIEPCFSSCKGTIRLFVAIAFCAASILALGCQSTPCCGPKSDDPGKLATVESGDSDSVSRGQSSDASSTNAPSAESAERHDRLFSETQKNDSQTTTGAESSSASATLATNDVSKNSPIIKEDINSMDFVPTTTEPTTKSTIPDVTPAPKASPQVPAIPNDVQTSNQNAGTMEQAPPSNGYQSVAPSPGQANQGATGEYSANSAQGNEVGLEVGKTESDKATESNKTEPSNLGNVTTEPPVEMDQSHAPDQSYAPSTFANEGSASLDSTKQTTANFEASEDVAPSQTEPSKTSDSTSTSTSSTQPSESDASRSPEKSSIVAPKLDAGVPVTFKPTALSRVVEVQTTSASNFLDSRADVARQSETRQSEKRVVSGGVGLITSESTVGKPIDASKDVARLRRIRSR